MKKHLVLTSLVLTSLVLTSLVLTQLTLVLLEFQQGLDVWRLLEFQQGLDVWRQPRHDPKEPAGIGVVQHSD